MSTVSSVPTPALGVPVLIWVRYTPLLSGEALGRKHRRTGQIILHWRQKKYAELSVKHSNLSDTFWVTTSASWKYYTGFKMIIIFVHTRLQLVKYATEKLKQCNELISFWSWWSECSSSELLSAEKSATAHFDAYNSITSALGLNIFKQKTSPTCDPECTQQIWG